ncbi:unnamed protein product [Blepharisma stoltei]|uniref:Protein YIPF n=1 Tax=Blepharisma stoltei TaxID=1481888 RepID=A0AAU9K1E7_9CILI|nr:unnamed protein product [Blepharisma stoltei]
MENKGYSANLLELDISDDKPAESLNEDAEQERIHDFEEYLKYSSKTPSTKNYKLWEIGYYRPFFDVDTALVVDRVKKSLLPFNTAPFFDDKSPDLYGSVWIAATLIFLLCAFGYIETYFETHKVGYHITYILTGCITVYGILAVIPIAIYCFFNYSGILMPYLNILSIYGYSSIGHCVGLLLCLYGALWWRIVATILSSLWCFGSFYMHLIKEVSIENNIRYIVAGIYLAGESILILVTNIVFFS